MFFFFNMLIVVTCIHSIAFKSVWHSFEKVAFRTHSSPCERVWHCLSSCPKGNLFIYICIAIPQKEGDVSVRKRSMTPWNCHLNKNYIPCRKSSIIYVEEVFFNKQLHFKKPLHSLRTVRHAFVQVSLKKMPSCFIPLVTLLAQKKNMVPANVVDRTVQQAGKHRNKEKTKKHIGKTEKQKNTLENKKNNKTLVQTPPLQRVWNYFFFVCLCFFLVFPRFFRFLGFRPRPKSMEEIFRGLCQILV